ncbi:MAG: hypothetical protein GQ581_03215 [Methyloprofundus sp.]|nr:hypothetical protein [Methyloprofundus sp.]
MLINRIFLIKLHMVVAAFIFPAALMFLLTGALYTWGIKGHYDTENFSVSLQQPMQNDKAWLTQLAIHELNVRELSLPSGKAKIKAVGNSYYFEWTGAQLDIALAPTSNPFVAQLKIKRTGWHRLFVQLHKAKGGEAFKVYAVILASGLLFLFMTGMIMAWQMTKYRPLLLSSASIGILFFMTMLMLS